MNRFKPLSGRAKTLLGPLAIIVVLAGAVWIDLARMPKATVAQPWPEFERSVLDSDAPGFTRTAGQHVDYYHHEDTQIGHFVELVDGFLDFLAVDFLPSSPKQRVSVFVSRNGDVHQLNSEVLFNNDSPASFGSYYPANDVVATHAWTGPGTVTSLLVYPVLRQNLNAAPSWAQQAIVTFFEKTYAVRQPGGRLAYRVGYQNPWRLGEIERLDKQSLKNVITGGPQVTQSHYRLVAMFLWRHGHFRDFIARLQENDLKGRENYVAAAFDLPMTEVEALWRDYLDEVDSRRDLNHRIPVSQIFVSETAFQNVMDGLAEPNASTER